VTGADFQHELVAGSRDVDNEHVDNAVIPAYIAQVREAFFREAVPRLEEYGRPVARLELDYHAELFAGDRIVGEARVCEIGTTSLTTEVTLRRDGEKAATGKTVQVILDSKSGEPIPVPEGWRAALRETAASSA
jgi:acyl-CoA thioester hydrolase